MKKFTQMTKEEREVYVVFKKYAPDDEMTMESLQMMGEDMNLDFELLRALVDDDGNGSVSFEEFFQFWTDKDRFKNFKGERYKTLMAWLDHFKSIDVDGNGTLCIDEIRKFCDDNRYEYDPAELFASLDKDGSGNVGFEEFLAWYQV